jgi:hypothetical protein
LQPVLHVLIGLRSMLEGFAPELTDYWVYRHHAPITNLWREFTRGPNARGL